MKNMSLSLQSLLSDEKEKESIRQRATQIFQNLEESSSSSSATTTIRSSNSNHRKSWIRRTASSNIEDTYPSQRCQFFDEHGFLLLKSFAAPSEVSSMKEQMHQLVLHNWNPNGDTDKNDTNNNTDNSNGNKLSVFRTDEKQIEAQGSNDYFLQSANQIHFFAESQALTPQQTLKPQFLHDKISALNKAGHALHLPPQQPFHTYTTSPKIKNLLQELGWEDPVVPQSMYIFKQAKVGAEVTSHQDSTFLYTFPKQSCMGLWLALDDSTIENGCLWVRPGSHWEKTRVKFARNPEHFGTAVGERSSVANGDRSKPQMIFIPEQENKNDDGGGENENGDCQPPPDIDIDWVGKIPDIEGCETVWDSLFQAGFVPVECKAGDLVAFPGELDHLSLPNVSEVQRHTFQLHLVEGEKAGVTWADSNWLQYPPGVPFMRINDDGDGVGDSCA